MPFVAVCPRCRAGRLLVPFRKRGDILPCPKCRLDFALVPDEEDEGEVEPAQAAPPVPVKGPEDSWWLGLLPFAAAGLGLLLCRLPGGRLAGLGLALGGVALAGLGLLDRVHRGRLGWAGLGLNTLLLLTLLAFPDRLGVEGWWGPAEAAIQADQGAEWIDAGENAWEENGIRVALTFAIIGPDPGQRSSNWRGLWIGVAVTNTTTQPIQFTPWNTQAAEDAILTSPDGTRIGGHSTGHAQRSITIEPGREAECLLAFEEPPAGADLRLQLSATASGGSAPVRFRIARSLVVKH